MTKPTSLHVWEYRDLSGKYDDLLSHLPIDEMQQAEYELRELGVLPRRNNVESLIIGDQILEAFPSPEDILIANESEM